MIMIKIKFVLITFIMLICISSCAKKLNVEELRVGVSPDFYPFEYTVNDSLTGLDIELVNLIAESYKIPVTYFTLPFPELLENLEKGEYDMVISAVTVTESRNRLFDFSDIYYEATQTVLKNKNSNISIDSLEAVNRFRIGVLNHSSSLLFLENSLVKDRKLQANRIRRFPNLKTMITSLQDNQIDVIFLEKSIAEMLTDNHNLKIAYIYEIEDNYAIAFPKNSSLYHPINKQLQRLINTDKWNDIKERYLLSD